MSSVGFVDLEANRAQASYFCAELHQRIALLDDEAIKRRSRMARLASIHQDSLVRALQDEMRSALVERRKIADMLAALGHRYPCVHA
jgi:hypothetical protein